MIDSHAHLNDAQFDADRTDIINQAGGAGIELIVCPGTSVASSRTAIELAHQHDTVLAAAGIHPHEANTADDAALAEIERLAADPRCVAIGEIGLDYFYEHSPRDVQRSAFDAQLALAKHLDKPAIIHCRDAYDDTLAALERTPVRGVMHCFSGDAVQALRFCDLGLMISFAGQITYPKADPLRRAARDIPAEHLMVETDSPYLAPQRVRGTRNEPANLAHTVRFLAGILKLTPEDVDRITTVNAKLLFGLPLDEKAALVYPIRDSLYVNLTTRCTNCCVFCPRLTAPRVKGHWLGLDRKHEPSADQIIAAIGDPAKYDEIVFCGFGEPTLRLDVMLEVAQWIKNLGGRTRLNTNGQGDLIAGEPIAPRMKGLIDTISVSINTADPAQYAKLCPSDYGELAYTAVLDFIRHAKAAGIDVVVTALDYPDVDTAAVEQIARDLGVTYRSRTYKHLG